MNKDQLFAWACSILKQRIDEGIHGSVIIPMQNGIIGNVKTEYTEKPPLELSRKTP